MAVQYKRVTVTPQIAREWLGKNFELNRLPKQSKIPMYARDMNAGRWNTETGETIKFDVHGDLIDGQNRLRAVLVAAVTNPDIAVDFDIATGCPTEAIRVIDTGAARTFADTLRIAGTNDRMRSSGVIRWVLNWDAMNYMGNGKHSPTNEELWDRYRKEPEAFETATKRSADAVSRGLGTASAHGMAFYLFYQIDPNEAHEFYDHLITGAKLEEGDPRLTLRNRLARLRIDRLTRQEQLALIIRAWNFSRANKTVDKLAVSRGDLSNDNFPQPK